MVGETMHVRVEGGIFLFFVKKKGAKRVNKKSSTDLLQR
jgi:hypothetical protein